MSKGRLKSLKMASKDKKKFLNILRIENKPHIKDTHINYNWLKELETNIRILVRVEQDRKGN